MEFSKKDLEQMHRVKRLNLINGITGIKPANLIGTNSEGVSNLTIISSVVHLGSNPALIGFIMRPSDGFRRDTLENILKTGVYTINHVHETIIENAHYTSVKANANVSEFDLCGFSEEYCNNFPAPFVREAYVKIGLKFIEKIDLPVNGTSMIVGEIEQIHLPDNSLDDKGYLRLDNIFSAGVGGLNTYYSLKRIATYPYVRDENMPNFQKLTKNI